LWVVIDQPHLNCAELTARSLLPHAIFRRV
jgi:hypothetical protein